MSYQCCYLLLVAGQFEVERRYTSWSGGKVIGKPQQTYAAEHANKYFAYDGDKSLFAIGALPQTKNDRLLCWRVAFYFSASYGV